MFSKRWFCKWYRTVLYIILYKFEGGGGKGGEIPPGHEQHVAFVRDQDLLERLVADARWTACGRVLASSGSSKAAPPPHPAATARHGRGRALRAAGASAGAQWPNAGFPE
jgi:hypothetical protein